MQKKLAASKGLEKVIDINEKRTLRDAAVARFFWERANVKGRARAIGVALFLAVSLPTATASARTTLARGGESVQSLVAADRIEDAARQLRRKYKLESPAGLKALHEFAMAVLRRGLDDKDPFEQTYAASALGAQGDYSGERLLVKSFATGDPGLRMAAADGLGDMGNAEAVSVLDRLYRATDPSGKRIIIQALTQVRDKSALRPLLAALKSKDETTRMLAVQGLGELGNPDALPELRSLLAHESKDVARVRVARAMLLLGDDSGLALIRKELQTAPDPDARAVAALALADARNQNEVPLLRQAMADNDIIVKLAVAAALTHYGNTEGLALLGQSLAEPDRMSRQLAGQVLAHVQMQSARSVIASALSSPDETVRLAATHAVGLLGGRSEVPLLLIALKKTQDPTMRADLAWALGRIGQPNCVLPLFNLVQEKESAVRYTAADGLARTTRKLLDGTLRTEKQ